MSDNIIDQLKVSKEIQLKTIEGLSLIFEEGFPSPEEAKNIINIIYRISHLNGTCPSAHLDWHEECRQLYQTLQDSGVIKKED